MSNLTIGLLVSVAVVALMGMRVPIGVAIALPSLIGLGLLLGDVGAGSLQATSTFFAVYSREGFAVIPMFIAMGTLAYSSGIANDLFGMFQRWLGGLRGGLAMATVLACGGFAGVTGSSVATVATFANSALPEMLRFGYHPRLAAGVVVAAGGLGSMIPPSSMLVIYGILAQQSIGQMLIGGIGSGLLLIVLYIVRIAIMTRLDHTLAPPTRSYPLRERIQWTSKAWPLIVIFGVVIGGIYTGVWQATEAAAAGVAAVVVVGILRRRLSRLDFWLGLRQAVVITATLGFILAGSFVFAKVLALSGLSHLILEYFLSLDVPPIVIFSLFVAVILVLGAMIDGPTILALTVPLMVPVMQNLGLNPIWFGVVMVKAAEVGLYTPPVGLSAYTLVASYPKIALSDVFRGALPFVFFDIIDIYLLWFFPQIVLFLVELAF